jgi:prepilin-type N-terminal cleavage/methylation domain-containing protein
MKIAQKGFTLVEVMISIAISAIIVFGVFGVLQTSNRQLQMIHAKMTLQERLREALFKMTQEIRQAPQKVEGNRILLTEDGLLNVAAVNGVESASKIIFSVPNAASLVVDGSYEPLWTTGIQYRRGDPALSGESENQLFRIATDPAGEKKQAILASDVTSLEFSRKTSTPTLITIALTARKVLSDDREITVQATAQAEARNP